MQQNHFAFPEFEVVSKEYITNSVWEADPQ